MKNIFSSLSDLTTFQKLSNLAIALCISSSAFAQAPQGFNYQAVVLNSAGAALSNQTVSLQLSILDSSASGVAVYVETQNPTTDTTGLFSVVIGNGTVVTGNFSTINWGKNNKFLKTEIDTAGGSNYVLMGISQMMSVPYALYTNPTFASIDYPDGLRDMTQVLIGAVPYTVPVGKNLFVPYGFWHYLITGNDSLSTAPVGLKGAGFSSNQVVYLSQDTIYGWIVNKTVDWITTDIIANSITVPPGKIFVVNCSQFSPSGFSGGTTYVSIRINGIEIPNNYLSNQSILYSGQVLNAVPDIGTGQYVVNGYFRDN